MPRIPGRSATATERRLVRVGRRVERMFDEAGSPAVGIVPVTERIDYAR